MTHLIGKVRCRVRRKQAPARPAGDAVRRALRGGDLQAKLRVGAVDDSYEREADAVAARVMSGRRGPGGALAAAPEGVQRMCSDCEDAALAESDIQRQPVEEEEEQQLQARARPDGLQRRVEHGEEDESDIQPKAKADRPFTASASVAAQVSALRGAGRPLARATRGAFESRFGADFSNVRVHTDARAARTAAAINARAFTSGRDIVFNAGEFSPASATGGELLAHELTHVLQQERGAPARVRRSTPRLRPRPAVNTPPCACLVFVHDNEHSARRAIENLHAHCRYNLAIIDRHLHGRRIRITGRNGDVDPNELFSNEIRTACERDLEASRRYADAHDDLRATQIAFYLAIRACSSSFALPVVALHNNTIGDTAPLRTVQIDQATLGGLPGIYHAEATEEGQLTREDLIDRLRSLGGVRRGEALVRMTGAERTTNIYRWCNLPEIGRCAVGDPDHPGDVIWTVRSSDFDRLAHHGLNLVHQTRGSEGGESDTDLSTLFLRIPTARYINIETPHRRPGEDLATSRLNNMVFILRALAASGLSCCDAPRTDETSDE